MQPPAYDSPVNCRLDDESGASDEERVPSTSVSQQLRIPSLERGAPEYRVLEAVAEVLPLVAY